MWEPRQSWVRNTGWPLFSHPAPQRTQLQTVSLNLSQVKYQQETDFGGPSIGQEHNKDTNKTTTGWSL